MEFLLKRFLGLLFFYLFTSSCSLIGGEEVYKNNVGKSEKITFEDSLIFEKGGTMYFYSEIKLGLDQLAKNSNYEVYLEIELYDKEKREDIISKKLRLRECLGIYQLETPGYDYNIERKTYLFSKKIEKGKYLIKCTYNIEDVRDVIFNKITIERGYL